MSGETLYEAPRKYNVAPIRVHDYLYDSAYIVSGARDYARTAFKAAMASAQLVIQPVYKTMFSELRAFPRMQVVYHPNCRLPPHMDRSYGAYLSRVTASRCHHHPQLSGRDRFKFSAVPRKVVLTLKSASPQFNPPTPVPAPGEPAAPRTRGTQSLYRESSAQTIPWQPDAKAADTCTETPEVMYLDKLEWGPGDPYRTGDLPADFHTTEIINKMRHARTWNAVAERTHFPRGMKKRDAIITDVETKDWIFREAEIDELQDIRMELLHRLQSQQREKQTNRISLKLAKRWADKKRQMEQKIDQIRRSRDRELRKLSALHSGGGRTGLVQRMRAARGGGDVILAAQDPTSDVHAPALRNGYQARRRHAEISYDPSLIVLEDHLELSEPPPWLEECGQNLNKTYSGHHLPRDPMKLCERETKWSERFLENLHDELKKARIGATGNTAGPLHVLKPRRLVETPRPATPEVESVADEDEENHQAALLMQRILRGRAVQCLMYEGRTRAAELTEELKTTHGLQKEDKVRIAKEEVKAREYNAVRTEAEQKEDAISALVDELCGGAVSTALDFLEKELRRLKEERRQHAFILIALREKAMREAAEAGRRQKEEHRRREHDEMFKQVLGVTQETVDAYLQQVIQDGVELAAELEATRRAERQADLYDDMDGSDNMTAAEQNDLVAELVHQFLLPDAHRAAARQRIEATQGARLEAARSTIFGLIDGAERKQEVCTQCGVPLDEMCRCRECPLGAGPEATAARSDPRWKHTKRRDVVVKPPGVRYPPQHELRCMLNVLVDEAIQTSRREVATKCSIRRDLTIEIEESIYKHIEAKEYVNMAVDIATGAIKVPARAASSRHYSRRVIGEAFHRTEPLTKRPCPLELPSETRRVAEERAAAEDGTCRCEHKARVQFGSEVLDATARSQLLPSELRALEELRRCKCDENTPTIPQDAEEMTTASSDPFAFDTSDTEDLETPGQDLGQAEGQKTHGDQR